MKQSARESAREVIYCRASLLALAGLVLVACDATSPIEPTAGPTSHNAEIVSLTDGSSYPLSGLVELRAEATDPDGEVFTFSPWAGLWGEGEWVSDLEGDLLRPPKLYRPVRSPGGRFCWIPRTTGEHTIRFKATAVRDSLSWEAWAEVQIEVVQFYRDVATVRPTSKDLFWSSRTGEIFYIEDHRLKAIDPIGVSSRIVLDGVDAERLVGADDEVLVVDVSDELYASDGTHIPTEMDLSDPNLSVLGRLADGTVLGAHIESQELRIISLNDTAIDTTFVIIPESIYADQLSRKKVAWSAESRQLAIVSGTSIDSRFQSLHVYEGFDPVTGTPGTRRHLGGSAWVSEPIYSNRGRSLQYVVQGYDTSTYAGMVVVDLVTSQRYYIPKEFGPAVVSPDNTEVAYLDQQGEEFYLRIWPLEPIKSVDQAE